MLLIITECIGRRLMLWLADRAIALMPMPVLVSGQQRDVLYRPGYVLKTISPCEEVRFSLGTNKQIIQMP